MDNLKHQKSECGRYICTKELPMPQPMPKNTQWIHPDAKDAGSGEYYDAYKCPYCGEYFREYLPDY